MIHLQGFEHSIRFGAYFLSIRLKLQSWTKHLETFWLLSTSELDYYDQKVNVRVASRVAERLKTQNLRKLRNFKNIPKMLGFHSEYPAIHPKAKFWRFSVKNRTKSAVKHSIEKLILLSFVNLSPTFCPRL